MSLVEVLRRRGPIVLGQPHGGTYVPEEIRSRFNDTGKRLADTDWHISRLYAGLLPDATIVTAQFHRYVLDANRDPSGESLYPGQNTTSLCPEIDFDGTSIYRDGLAPGASEIAERRDTYHQAYHEALAGEIVRIRELHGYAVLYDCHSVRSVAPYLFDGTLPVFNLGTFDGQSCRTDLEAAAVSVCRGAERDGYDWILNGRFKGGWTTRHYGRPENGVHALQMELAQRSYMCEAEPWLYAEERASRVRKHLAGMLRAVGRAASQDPGRVAS